MDLFDDATKLEPENSGIPLSYEASTGQLEKYIDKTFCKYLLHVHEIKEMFKN